jgi:hypothetical protein
VKLFLKRIPHNKYPSLIIATLLLINSVIIYVNHAKNGNRMDFFTLWVVPYLFYENSSENIYSPDTKYEYAEILRNKNDISESQKQISELVTGFYNGKVEITSTPLLYSFFAFISCGDYDSDKAVFIVISLIAFILAVIILCILLKIPMLMSILLLAFFLSMYEPLKSQLAVGNVNSIQLFSISLFLLILTCSKYFYHLVIAGFIIGMSIMFKPNVFTILLFIGIIYLIDKKFKKLIGLATGVIGAVVISLILSAIHFGQIRIWLLFLKSLPETLDLSISMELGNLSLASYIHNYTGSNISSILLLVFTISYIVIILISRKGSMKNKNDHNINENKEEIILATGIGCSVTLLTMGLTWLHYYILLIPLILYLVKPLTNFSSVNIQSKLLVIIALASLIMFTDIPGYITENTIENYALQILLATSMVTVASYYKIWHRRMLQKLN